MIEMNKDNRIRVLLAEYRGAQSSAQHHDSLIWNAIGMIWAAQLVLLGFIIQSIREPLISPLILVICFVALILLVFLFIEYFSFRRIRSFKYERCKQIEEELGLKQHSSLPHTKLLGTISFIVVTVLFSAVWILITLFILIN